MGWWPVVAGGGGGGGGGGGCLPATSGAMYSTYTGGGYPVELVLVMYFLVCSAAYTSYSDSHLYCMVVHGGGGGAGGGGGGGSVGGGCTGGCCPCSTGTYAGATFCNLYCVVVVVASGGGLHWCVDVLVVLLLVVMVVLQVLMVSVVVGQVGAAKVKQKEGGVQ